MNVECLVILTCWHDEKKRHLNLALFYYDQKQCNISDLHVWQIDDEKLVNKGTGQEYQRDPLINAYQLNDKIFIEERHILEYPNNVETAQDKWKICPEEDGTTFKIRCASSGRFLRATSKYEKPNAHIILGNFLILVVQIFSFEIELEDFTS